MRARPCRARTLNNMDTNINSTEFEQKWFELAERICLRIYQQPEVKEMRKRFKAGERLTEEERSNFIAIANRVKYEVIYEEYGQQGTQEFEHFRQQWKYWFNHKEGTSDQLHGRRLTNAEHIVYSSTPDPEEFLSNGKFLDEQ